MRGDNQGKRSRSGWDGAHTAGTAAVLHLSGPAERLKAPTRGLDRESEVPHHLGRHAVGQGSGSAQNHPSAHHASLRITQMICCAWSAVICSTPSPTKRSWVDSVRFGSPSPPADVVACRHDPATCGNRSLLRSTVTTPNVSVLSCPRCRVRNLLPAAMMVRSDD